MKYFILSIFCCVLLTGCGGTKILKKPLPLNLENPITSQSDNSISVSLDGVIFRDGPGTWAKDADWDEYLLSVTNNTDENIILDDVVVVDSVGTELHTNSDRKELVKASKETVTRYKNVGLEVKAGLRPGQILASGAATTGGVALATSMVGASVGGWGGFGIAAGGAVIGVAAIPVFSIYALVRMGNNDKVAKEILARQTQLPMTLSPGSQYKLDMFFPLAPSPQLVKITLKRGDEHRILDLDTSELLTGLHVGQNYISADSVTQPTTSLSSKENNSLNSAAKELKSDGLFDSRTGMHWKIVPTLPVNLSTAKIMCKSIDITDGPKYRLPTLHEFEQLWKGYKGVEKISAFNKKEYIASDEHSAGYSSTFSFLYGSEGYLYAANLVCVRKQ